MKGELVVTDPLQGVTFGDLHLLAGRQDHFQSEAWFRHWRADFDLCVLNGDIFDFRWAKRNREGEAMDTARAWVEHLVARPVRARFIFITGNHDAVAPYTEMLESFSLRYEHVRWAEHWVRLGNKAFFHGDFPDDSGEFEQLRAYRRKHRELKHPGRSRRGIYWVASRLGLTGALPRALPWRKYCVRSDRFLEETLGRAYQEVEDVYLGHTHVHYRDLEHGGRRFHNSGAPVRGGAFQPITFPFIEEDWAGMQSG